MYPGTLSFIGLGGRESPMARKRGDKTVDLTVFNRSQVAVADETKVY